jgi:hypothetical protein
MRESVRSVASNPPPRGRPFTNGNSGRKPGSKNRSTTVRTMIGLPLGAPNLSTAS